MRRYNERKTRNIGAFAFVSKVAHTPRGGGYKILIPTAHASDSDGDYHNRRRTHRGAVAIRLLNLPLLYANCGTKSTVFEKLLLITFVLLSNFFRGAGKYVLFFACGAIKRYVCYAVAGVVLPDQSAVYRATYFADTCGGLPLL